MKTVILAGGLGTRLSEETTMIPKPMVEIGGKPILWHIMKIYSYYGFNDFIILTGYKSHVIKDYFINYYTRYSDITIDMVKNEVEIHRNRTEPWRVTMLYTGQNTMTGGRLLEAQNHIGNERFMLTYGDGVANIDIPALLRCHEEARAIATLTAVYPEGRFGVLDIGEDAAVGEKSGRAVRSFQEKPRGESGRINGGFFVMESAIFDYLKDGEATILERAPLETLAREGKLNAYCHEGFWRCMDTLKDKNELTALWQSDKAPWSIWLGKK
jgi:glucose-1-phosphate cytidylyltransferase